jgi:hypothetical protein
MKNKKFAIVIIFLLLECHSIIAQSNFGSIKKYIVFTFEVTKKHSKEKDYYYWITPQDSIEKKMPFQIYPFYTQGYSKDALENCKSGRSVDIFAASTATDFEFESKYTLEVKKLVNSIDKNKLKVQDFRKRWGKQGNEVNVAVYATPIIGQFCGCWQSRGSASSEFKGLIYLPVISFSYDNVFWNSKDAIVVKNVDYSYVEYSSHYPSYMHGNSNISVNSKFGVGAGIQEKLQE